jgi:parvulin-like peptidyl-prolyl isomerase
MERTEESENAVFDQADSVETLSERMKLDEIGSTLNLPVRESDMVPGFAMLPGVAQAEDGEDWVFNEGVVGEVSELFETQRAYYLVELLERDEERTLTLEEATPTIRESITSQKRRERAQERAREAAERLRAGAAMTEVASAFGARAGEAGPFTRGDFVPELGRFTPVIGTAFGLKPGETSGVIVSDLKIFIVRVESRADAERAAWEQQKEQQRQRVVQNLTEQRWQQFLQALRENAEIVDNREQVLNPRGQPAAAT